MASTSLAASIFELLSFPSSYFILNLPLPYEMDFLYEVGVSFPPLARLAITTWPHPYHNR